MLLPLVVARWRTPSAIFSRLTRGFEEDPIVSIPFLFWRCFMKKCFVAASLVASIVLVGYTIAGESVKSGPQVGQNARPMPFFPLNINGPTPDKKECLVCRNGNNPVAMIFARDTDPVLVKLMKELDAVTVKNADKKMGSFAVFCNDAEGLPTKLKTLATKEELKKFTLSIDNPTGPAPYNISKDADVTVVLYNKSKVIANFTYKKGQLKESDIPTIVAEASKLVK